MWRQPSRSSLCLVRSCWYSTTTTDTATTATHHSLRPSRFIHALGTSSGSTNTNSSRPLNGHQCFTQPSPAVSSIHKIQPSLTSSCSLSYSTFSSWTGARGHDITAESLEWGSRPKVIVTAMAPTGFDVQNTVKRTESESNSINTDYASASVSSIDREEWKNNNGSVHMNGSILVFPFGCFLWKIRSIHDVTLASLAPVILHRPKVNYLFIGYDQESDNTSRSTSTTLTSSSIPNNIRQLQDVFRTKHGIVLETMGLSNAMGTFNILNAEDRQVAVALILNKDSEATDALDDMQHIATMVQPATAISSK